MAQITSYNPITEGVIWKQILFFFFPMLLSSFFQQLYNTADALIVGRAAGKAALSAVGGSAGSVLGIFIMFYVGFAGGASVLAAQYFGAKKEAALRAAVRSSLVISAGLGLAGSIFCFFFARPVLTMMHTPADVMGPSLQYLRITALGMIPNALYNMGASALRSMGDARRPLLVLVFTCLFNIAMDLWLVAGLHMGAAGAALATVLSQFLSALLVLLFLRRSVSLRPAGAGETGTGGTVSEPDAEGRGMTVSGDLESAGAGAEKKESSQGRLSESAGPGSASGRSVPRDMAGRIFRMGFPLGLTEVMYTLANVVLMAAINTFGTDTVAAYAAYGKIDAIFWMVVGSFGISITTFVGQNIGAGKWDRVMQSIRDCAVMMFIILGLVIAGIYIFAEPLQGLFITDPKVIEIGVRMMRFLMPFYLLYIPIEILFGALRGMGNSLAPTLLTFFGVCVLRSSWGLFVAPRYHSVNVVLAGFPITWVITDIAFAVYFIWFIRRIRPAGE